MNASKRREEILTLLQQSDVAVSATTLAAKFSVSRQIIVGDVALLRAAGAGILATPRGYLLEQEHVVQFEKRIAACHSNERMGEELYTIIDLGGTVLDSTVEHSIYGEICVPLRLSSRFEVDEFLRKCQASGARPLCDLTGGIHLHTIRCADEKTMARIEQALREKGLLFEENELHGTRG